MELAQRPAKRLLSLADWRTLAKGNDAASLADAYLRKFYSATVRKAEGAAGQVLDFIISTGTVDRDQDTVAVAGWDFANFLKNPVVLWAHMYDSFPVAKALSISLGGDSVTSRAEFMSQELQDTHSSAFGYTTYRLYLEGFLNAVSVGFIPKKWTMVNDETSGRRYAYDILEQELLEYSCVPVPANAQALQLAASKGIDLAPMKLWCESFLDGVSGPGFWAPRDLAEQTFFALSRKGVSMIVPGKDDGLIRLDLRQLGTMKTIKTVAGVKADGEADPDATDDDEAKADVAAQVKATYKAIVAGLSACAHVVALHGKHLTAGGMSPDDEPVDEEGKALGPIALADVAKVVDGLVLVVKAGARHSAADVVLIQAIHDKALELGAACKVVEAPAEGADGATTIGAGAKPQKAGDEIDLDALELGAADDVDLDAIEASAEPVDDLDLAEITSDDIRGLVSAALRDSAREARV